MRNPMQPKPPRPGMEEKDLPKNRKATLLRLLPYWKHHAALMSVMLLCALISTGSTLFTPWLIGHAIDDCMNFVNGLEINFLLMSRYLILLVVVYLLGALCAWAQGYGMVYISQQIANRLRSEMMVHLQSLDLRFYDTHQRGDLMSRFVNDVETMKDGLGETLIQLFTTLFSLVGMIATMFALCTKLTLLICLTIPLVLLLSRLIISKTRKYFAQQQKALGQLNSVIEEGINGIKVVRSFAREDYEQQIFDKYNIALRESGIKAQIYSGILMPLLRVLDNFTYIVVAVFGGILAVQGVITIGVIQSFLLYTRHFLRPVNQIASQMNMIQSAIAGAERVFALLDEKPEIVNAEKPLKPQITGNVEFKNVFFGYEPQKTILKGVSFVAKQGDVVAIVGSTGAGKTTIMNLLTRFYDVYSGSIILDGIDIRNIDIAHLRSSLGIVLQDPVLFSDSIYNNIAYGNKLATKDSVINASKLANADAFINRLANNYQTVLVRQGDNISHGQRQLLTIARAIISDAPILIFDEATSNIDTHTENLIQQAISNLTKGRTCFIIAHRLSTIKNANIILVIDDGKIVEHGTHYELLNKHGKYFEIYNSQFSYTA